jgi:hypothetical protein
METKKQFSRGYAIGAAVLATVFAFVVLEAASRLWLSVFANNKQIALYGTAEQVQNLEKRYERHPYLPFIPLPNYRSDKNRHNTLGYRGDEISIPKPESEFRIACLGGSTTYTTSVEDYTQSYPHLLQRYLSQKRAGLKVINAGCGKYSSWETLINLSFRVLELQPDLVIVYQNVNDVHCRLVYPYSAYRADNTASRKPYSEPRENVWTRSTAIRILATRLGLRKSMAGLLFFRTHDYVETNYTMEFCEQKRLNIYPSGIFTRHPASEMLIKNPPIYFEKNMETIVALCKANDIDVVLLTFASSPHFPNNPMSYTPEYRNAIKEHNEIIKTISLRKSIHCFDLASQMPTNPDYWCDGNHVNEKGSNTKAGLVAAYLEQSGLLP